MSKIGVIGTGSTKFRRKSGASDQELAQHAVMMAIQDAGIDKSQIGAAFVGSVYGSYGVGQRALKDLGLVGIPITNVENACASGSDALLRAAQTLELGLIDAALVVGVETPSSSLADGEIPLASTDSFIPGLGVTFPAIYALRAERHMRAYGTTIEQLAAVSVKNRGHGEHNDFAVFQSQVAAKEVINSPKIAGPLTKLMSCMSVDGAAALVLAREGLGVMRSVFRGGWLSSGALQDDASGFDNLTEDAALKAYEISGIGPEELDLAEVHDAFTIGELLAIEELGIVTKGKSGYYVESGKAQLGGQGVVVNPGGGLLSRGHPMGATGVAQAIEVSNQLCGRGGARQVEGARVGLCHTKGGGVLELEANACSVLIFTKD